MNNSELKLHLGCGKNYLQGYVNIDLHSRIADIQHDLTTPLPYQDNSIDEIISIHLIEHFTRMEWQRTISDWTRVLKRGGGRLIIECPDFDRCVHRFFAASDKERWGFWMLTIFGGQEPYGEGQLHKNGFTVEKLKKDLENEGFAITKIAHKRDETFDDEGFNIHMQAVRK